MELISGILTVLITIPTIIYAYFKYKFNYWKSKGIPCDEPSIPYGHIKELGKKSHISKILKKIYDKYRPTGVKMCGIYFFSQPLAFLLDLDLIKCVLVKEFANFDSRNMYYNENDDPLSANLVTLDGDKWKKLRFKLTPTFTSGKMKFMCPTVVEVGERLRDCLSKMVQQNDVVEIKELCARFTTDVIGSCAFGIECNSLTDLNAEFRHYGRKLITQPRHSSVFMALLRQFENVGRKLHIKLLRNEVSAFFLNVVKDSIEYRQKYKVSRNDFMELLMKLLENQNEANEMGDKLTFNELAAQAFIFFVAGFETSSSALTFCLYELALHPKIQNKARRVIHEAYKKSQGQLTYEMMMDIPYIDQILEETLRKYPTGPFLTRRTKEDYPVDGTDIVINGGTTVLIPVYAIHYDPKYYPNPEQFDPDRFSSEEKSKRHSMAWLAFGDGPRNCIGLRFGMMQARIGLVILLTNFEFSLSSETKVPVGISKKIFLTVPEDVHLKVKSLKN